MRFVVRQIALKSSGEEIVRRAVVESDVLVIGRDGSSGMHLPDLAVDPRHARIRAIDGETLLIESIGAQPFTVNGRSATSSELDVATGAELGFGGHRITLAREAESGLPAFTVRRVEAVSESAEAIDIGSAYTLQKLLPGKRLAAWGFAALVLLAFLAVPIWSWATYQPLALHKDARRPAGIHGDAAWSSGTLSLAHKNLGGDCQACHVQAFVAVRDNACMTCHKEDAHQHIADGARLLKARGEPGGFAGFQRAVAKAFNKPAGRCVDCHTEHEGAGAMPATQQQFCTTCHDGLKTRLPDTQIADAADFGTAHPQFRPMLVAGIGGDGKPMVQRAVWQDGMKERTGLKFTHAQHLSTTNGIAQMVRRRSGEFASNDALGCKDCHQTGSGGARFKPVEMEKACQSCHALTFDEIGGTFRTLRHGQPDQVVADLRAAFRGGMPPRPASLSGMARRIPGAAAQQSTAADFARAVHFYPMQADAAVAAVFSKGGLCYDCHTIGRGGSAATAGFTVQRPVQNGRYYSKGWFDHKDHRKSECVTCHVKAATSNDADAVLVPGIDGAGGCRSCHVGEGGAKLASAHVKEPVASGCAMCHEYHMDSGAPWKPAEQRKGPALLTAAWDRTRHPPAPR